MMAQTLDVEELAITEDEGKSFMNAAKSVLRHYNVQTTQKTFDWIALVGVTATIYAPRIAAIGWRKRSERQSPASKSGGYQGAEVIHFSGGLHSQNPDDFMSGSAS